MRQPWKESPVVFRIIIQDRRPQDRRPKTAKATSGVGPKNTPSTSVLGASPGAGQPMGRASWRTIAAAAGAGLLGWWLLRTTKPPRPWLEANHAKARRLELETRRLDDERAARNARLYRDPRSRPIAAPAIPGAPVIDLTGESTSLGESEFADAEDSPVDRGDEGDREHWLAELSAAEEAEGFPPGGSLILAESPAHALSVSDELRAKGHRVLARGAYVRTSANPRPKGAV